MKVKLGETVISEYSYNGFNQRIKKTVSGVTTHYRYNPSGNLIAESTGEGVPLRDYIYVNGERVAMMIYGTQAGVYYFLNDHLGTPHKIVDTDGIVVWEAAYPPFGEAQIQIETVVCNFRFPGQYYDAETGLHNNWHRYYDPSTGRYLTPDPIGLAGGINLFSYAQNDPINAVDPFGLFEGIKDYSDTLRWIYGLERIRSEWVLKNQRIGNSYNSHYRILIFTPTYCG